MPIKNTKNTNTIMPNIQYITEDEVGVVVVGDGVVVVGDVGDGIGVVVVGDGVVVVGDVGDGIGVVVVGDGVRVVGVGVVSISPKYLGLIA